MTFRLWRCFAICVESVSLSQPIHSCPYLVIDGIWQIKGVILSDGYDDGNNIVSISMSGDGMMKVAMVMMIMTRSNDNCDN